MARPWQRWRSSYRELQHGTTYLGAIMIVLVGLGAAIHLLGFRTQLFDSVERNADNLARAFEQDVAHSLREVDWTIRLLRSSYLARTPSFDFVELTKQLNSADGLTLQYSIIGPDGFIAQSSLGTPKERIDLRDREHFRVHVSSTQDHLFISQPVLGRLSGKWTVQLARRITNPDGSFGGVIIAAVDPGHFSRLYNAIDVGANGMITLVGLDGVVRSSRGRTAEGAGQSIQGSPYFAAISQRPEGLVTANSAIDGIRRVGAYRRVADLPLIVAVEFSEAEVLAKFMREFRNVAILGLLLSAVILVGIGRSARSRAKLRATAESLQSAEQVAWAQKNELQERDQREAMLRHEAAMQQQVGEFNDRLLSSIKKFSTTINDLAVASKGLMTAAADARQSGEKITEASNLAADHVAQITEGVDQLSSAAGEISDKTRDTASIFAGVTKETEITNHLSEELDAAISSIDGVVGSIQSIAKQTNLLALNATIEAARAGNAGRGFAIVAGEVKTLASQTSKATQDIQQQISALQTAAAASVSALRNIRTQILAVREITESINETVSRHSSFAHEIARNMQETTAQSRTAFTSARTLAAAIELSCESTTSVIDLARELDAEAKRISAEADSFSRALQRA